MKKIVACVLFLFLTLLLFAPWLTVSRALFVVENRIEFVDKPFIKRIPFGVIVKGNVGACPICPAFLAKTYYVSPIYTIHLVKNEF